MFAAQLLDWFCFQVAGSQIAWVLKQRNSILFA
jgi:hypothetical protein